MLQAGMLFHSQYAPESAIYHDIFTAHLQAPFDELKLRRVMQRLHRLHPVLRSSFELSHYGAPMQLVWRQVEEPLQVEDVRDLPIEQQEAVIERWLEAEKGRPFVLESAPLLRWQIHWRSENSFQLTVSFHHAILDGWSVASLLTELMRGYPAELAGRTEELTEPEVSFRDFVAQELHSIQSEEDQRFWRKQLTEIPRVKVPRWRVPTPEEQQQRVVDIAVSVSAELVQGLRAVANRAAVPLKSVLLAAHMRVLQALGGERECVTGLVLNGRPETQDGERVLGLFLNSLPFRLKLEGGSWLELVEETFAAERELLPHRRYPLAQMQKEHGGEPLFEVAFNYTHFHVYEQLKQEAQVQVIEGALFEQTNFTLIANFSLDVETDLLQLNLRADAQQLPREQVEALAHYYRCVLTALAEQPEERYEWLDLLTEEERQQQLSLWNATQSAYPAEATLPQLFTEQVALRPDAIALVYGDEQWSYAYLDQQTDRLARVLRGYGVEAEVSVGLYLERSLHMIVALLGILKAGGTYVPLDPQLPVQRLHWQIRDAQVRFLLTHSALEAQLPHLHLPVLCLDQLEEEDFEEEVVDGAASALQLAYVMYTSGSTGTPKGVGVPHRAIIRLVKENSFLTLRETNILLQFAPLAFDASTLEIWGTLLTGARLVVFEPQLPALDELARVLQQYAVNVLWLTAGLFHQMVESQIEILAKVDTVLAGGDVLNVGLVRQLLRQGGGRQTVINGYGPTENTTFTCCYPMVSEDQVGETVPIGRPISNTTVYVLDEEMQPIPVGAVGELYTGGDGLARGYWQQAELTAERFVPDPFSKQPGARLYRTGDLVRYLIDGRLEFVGRRDQQLKVRGFRIEPGEIETVLARHEQVHECVVILRKAETGESYLVACMTGEDPALVPADDELRQYVRERLPEYMVPSYFLWLEALPLTPNGKVDRRELMRMQAEGLQQQLQQSNAQLFVPPWDEIEFRLMRIWEEVLQIQPVGVSSNFFDLGGHSLTAIRLMSRIRQEFEQDIALEMLFQLPTVAQLATALRNRTAGSSTDRVLVPLQTQGSNPALFCVHPAGGTAFCYANLSRLLGSEQPFYALRLPEWSKTGQYPAIAEQAAMYLEAIRSVQPHGPYLLGGWSFGGIVAFEMARQLEQQGEEVAFLALIDSAVPRSETAAPQPALDDAVLVARAKGMLEALNAMQMSEFERLSLAEQLEYICQQMIKIHMLPADADVELARRFLATIVMSSYAARTYVPHTYSGRITFFRATESVKLLELEDAEAYGLSQGEAAPELAGGWQHFTSAGIDVHLVPGDHEGIVVGSAVQHLATALRRSIDAVLKQ